MCQFIEISNQMEPNGEVSNIEQKNLYNALLYIKNFENQSGNTDKIKFLACFSTDSTLFMYLE